MSDDPEPRGAVVAGATIRVGIKEFTWRPGVVVTVGREPECDVVVDDPKISRKHLCIEAADGGMWRLRDPGSRNGVFVSGRRIDSEPLDGSTLAYLGAS